ncbi:MAG: YkgJ family cysteine cluster protein [Natronomonas sp.]
MSDDTPTGLEAELRRAKDLDVEDLAETIQSIGFECTRCGGCCKAVETESGTEDHTATVFPDEVRELKQRGGEFEESYDWRDVARPMPYGTDGETFEWALAVDDCGDCTFYEESDDGVGRCTVHDSRPLICRTYPFSVALDGGAEPSGAVVQEEGMVRAHECEGLGGEISRGEAEELAAALKRRTIRELEEAVAVVEGYEPTDTDELVVFDSEGPKRADGSRLREDER